MLDSSRRKVLSIMQSLQSELENEVQATPPAERPTVDLRVVDVRKSFASPSGERIEVLRGVSLEVKAGETVAIVGASGSGKSTLLHLLGGLDDPDHGSISLANTELGSLRGDAMSDFRQRHIGFVFQFHYLLTDLSAAENVTLPLLISRHSSVAAKRRTTALLTEMGLAARADYPTSHLSGGEQQRVAMARALVTSPRFLLADEPTGNLDAAIGDEIGKTLANYVRSRNAIAMIATHNKTLASLCDRVMLLEGGRLHPF
jgi:lipoprotein-releasing system ATP-binding protein